MIGSDKQMPVNVILEISKTGSFMYYNNIHIVQIFECLIYGDS